MYQAPAKILYSNKRDGENVGHIIQNFVILNRNFQWRNLGPNQTGHNKRLVILSAALKAALTVKHRFMADEEKSLLLFPFLVRHLIT